MMLHSRGKHHISWPMVSNCLIWVFITIIDLAEIFASLDIVLPDKICSNAYCEDIESDMGELLARPCHDDRKDVSMSKL